MKFKFRLMITSQVQSCQLRSCLNYPLPTQILWVTLLLIPVAPRPRVLFILQQRVTFALFQGRHSRQALLSRGPNKAHGQVRNSIDLNSVASTDLCAEKHTENGPPTWAATLRQPLPKLIDCVIHVTVMRKERDYSWEDVDGAGRIVAEDNVGGQHGNKLENGAYCAPDSEQNLPARIHTKDVKQSKTCGPFTYCQVRPILLTENMY